MSLVSPLRFIAKKTISFLSLLVFFLFMNPMDIYSNQSVLLKSGQTIKGIILEQNAKVLTIKLENGITESIDKSKILKVIYKELTPEEERKIRINEERKILETKPTREMDIPPSQKNLKTNEDNRNSDNSTPNSEIQIMLFTVHGKNCVPYASQTEWFWLYGNLPLSSVDWSSILPKEKKLIQIRWDSTWKDTLITIFVGTLTSISRKTLSIEICELESDAKKTINIK